MRFLPFVLSLVVMTSAEGRIGETSIQFVDRYGGPKDTPTSKVMDNNSPLVEGAIHHRDQYQGWRIRAAFLELDGPAVRMEFSKLPNGQNGQIQDYELEAIKTANTPVGMRWKQIPYNNPDSPNGLVGKMGDAFPRSDRRADVAAKRWRDSFGPEPLHRAARTSECSST